MMFRIVRVLIVLLLSYTGSLYGQEAQKVTIASPEMASIPLYSQYPVDHVSGVPNISIPLLELSTRIGKIPISLSYHVGKLKPGELVGPVGYGWSLSPTMGITRSVNGGEDAIGQGFPSNSALHSNSTSILNGYSYRDAAANNAFDEQPDDFYYSLLGKSGQFMYNNTGNFSTLPYEPIQISYVDNDHFIIKDDDGTQYKFGKYTTHTGTPLVEWSNVNSNQTRVSWKLTEIISFDQKETIRFNYSAVIKNSIPVYSPQVKIEDQLQPVYTEGKKPIRVFGPGYSSETTMYPYYPTDVSLAQNGHLDENWAHKFDVDIMALQPTDNVISLTSSKYNSGFRDEDYGTAYQNDGLVVKHTVDQYLLTSIVSTSGSVFFSYNGILLQQVELRDAGNQVVQKAELSQSAYSTYDSPHPYASTNQQQRYRLDAVKLYGRGLAAEGLEYQLSYTGTHVRNHRGAWGTDFWGYGSSLMPGVPVYVEGYRYPYQDPEYPDLPYPLPALQASGYLRIGGEQEVTVSPGNIPAGILRSVKYPTGGQVDFVFESNRYRSAVADQKQVYGGGVRIKEIIYKAVNMQDSLVKQYKYGWNEDGMGRTRYKIYASNLLSPLFVRTYIPSSDWPSEIVDQMITTVSAKPRLGMSFASGAPILYPEVTEYVTELLNNESLGKTLYRYNLAPAQASFQVGSPSIADYRDGWKDHYLRDLEQYKRDGSGYVPVSKKQFEYTQHIKETIRVADTYRQYSSNSTSPGTEIAPVSQKFHRMAYEFQTGANKLTREIETLFEGGQQLITQTDYTYDPGTLYLRKQSRQNSREGLQATEYTYVKNRSEITNHSTGQPALLANLETANRLKELVETRSYEDAKLLSTVRQEYGSFNSRIYPSAILGANYSSALERKSELGQYDLRGNPVELNKANDVKEVYVWGYRGQYPVAKIIGTDWNDVKTKIDTALLNTGTAAQISTQLAALRTAYASNGLVQVFTYTYAPLIGMLTETDANGRTISYEYDTMNRLSVIKDQDGRVLKKYCYNYAGQVDDCSATTAANWQNTATAIRCKKTAGNQNTGEQEREQRDMNVNSPTYNQLRWIVTGTNLTACPLPPVCNSGNCSGEGYKCVNGVCELGVRVCISSVIDPITMLSTNTFRYEYSDASWSENFTVVEFFTCAPMSEW